MMLSNRSAETAITSRKAQPMTTGQIKATSLSALHEFESCALRAKLRRIDKIKDPSPPNAAGERGTLVHDQCEAGVKGKGEIPPEALKYFKPEFTALTKSFKTGNVSLEGEWGFNNQWQPTDWFGKDVWLRVKLDAMVLVKPYHAVIIDYKTGRKFGNEIKHGEQCQSYAVATLVKFPAIQHVTTELWYLDQDELTRAEYSREQGMRMFKPFDKRFKRMTEATKFLPTPSLLACKYCPYHPVRGTGDCKVGV